MSSNYRSCERCCPPGTPQPTLRVEGAVRSGCWCSAEATLRSTPAMKQHSTSVCSCKIAFRMGILASVRQTWTRTAACITRVWYSTCSTAVNRYARRYRSMWTMAVSIPQCCLPSNDGLESPSSFMQYQDTRSVCVCTNTLTKAAGSCLGLVNAALFKW